MIYFLETNDKRIVRSENYNTIFDKNTGFFARWGKTKKDDPEMAPLPEIADIEISSGKCHNNCPFCYKANTAKGELHNMTFDEFRIIFHKLALTKIEIKFKDNKPSESGYLINELDSYKDCFTKEDMINSDYEYLDKDGIEYIKIYNEGLLNQIAFGITSPKDNPDFFKMMKYARNFDVIPNYTIKGTDMTPEIAQKTAEICGACAVSMTENKLNCYNAVNMLLATGMKQVNIHAVAMDSTYNQIIETIKDIHNKNGINGLNALVLLKYKPKGTNAGKFKPLTSEQYKTIFELAEKNNVALGFDSCSAHEYLKAIEGKPQADKLAEYAEPCESTLFSVYINSYGKMYPCSFCEDEPRYENMIKECGLEPKGIDLLNLKPNYNEKDFCENIWFNTLTEAFRKKLLENKRHCPVFNLGE